MTKNVVLLLVGFIVGVVATSLVIGNPESGILSTSSDRQLVAPAGSPERIQAIRMIRTAPEGEAAVGPDESSPERTVTLTGSSSLDATEVESGLAVGPGLGAPGGAAATLADSQSSTEQAATDDVSGPSEPSDALPTALPEAYRSLVEPPSPRRLRPDEVFARFASEERDEAWAYPMELGINQQIAATTKVGTVIESVECRSTACVIAGYSLPGTRDEWAGMVRDMSQSGWWQATGPTMFMSGANEDGTARFVTIQPRTPEGATEFSSNPPTIAPGTAIRQTVELERSTP